MSMEPFEEKMRRGGDAALLEASDFLAGNRSVQFALKKVTKILQSSGISYAIAGDMALVAHGYNQTTSSIEIIVTPAALHAIHKNFIGAEYSEIPSSHDLRDNASGVRIKFVVSDTNLQQPYVARFRDAAECLFEYDGIKYVSLSCLIQNKLESGISKLSRIKDLADVQELIRARKLSADFAQQLHPYVRDKYMELWNAIQQDTTRDD
jgi:hypothetical protein